MEFYIYICKRRNDNNYYYNYRKSPRAATIGDDGVLPIEKLATSSGLTPLIVTALYRRNANASCVTWLSCCNNIPPSYDRPNASSFVVVIIISHFFFQKYIYADYLGFRRKTERRCLVQSTGLIFFFFARIYSIITLSKQYFVYSLGNSEDPHMIHLNYLFFFSAFFKFFPSLFQPRETLRRYRTLFTLI